jgi:hypothetical protein
MTQRAHIVFKIGFFYLYSICVNLCSLCHRMKNFSSFKPDRAGGHRSTPMKMSFKPATGGRQPRARARAPGAGPATIARASFHRLQPDLGSGHPPTLWVKHGTSASLGAAIALPGHVNTRAWFMPKEHWINKRNIVPVKIRSR